MDNDFGIRHVGIFTLLCKTYVTEYVTLEKLWATWPLLIMMKVSEIGEQLTYK